MANIYFVARQFETDSTQYSTFLQNTVQQFIMYCWVPGSRYCINTPEYTKLKILTTCNSCLSVFILYFVNKKEYNFGRNFVNYKTYFSRMLTNVCSAVLCNIWFHDKNLKNYSFILRNTVSKNRRLWSRSTGCCVFGIILTIGAWAKIKKDRRTRKALNLKTKTQV